VRALGWAPEEAPFLVGVQAARCAPVVRAFERGDLEVQSWPGDGATVAAGLRVPAPSEGGWVLECVRASGGSMVAVDDDEIVGSIADLATNEGVLACPEGAATVAAANALAASGALEGPVVLYNTGTGVKYADAVERAGRS
jgi:threonine synthase